MCLTFLVFLMITCDYKDLATSAWGRLHAFVSQSTFHVFPISDVNLFLNPNLTALEN